MSTLGACALIVASTAVPIVLAWLGGRWLSRDDGED